MKNIHFTEPGVAAIFASYPPKLQKKLLALRKLILDTAAKLPEVGELQETLKWNQPSYLPVKQRVGTTIRIDAIRDSETEYAMYVPCSTTLIADFRKKYGKGFNYEKQRAIQFKVNEALPRKEIADLVKMALTYHL